MDDPLPRHLARALARALGIRVRRRCSVTSWDRIEVLARWYVSTDRYRCSAADLSAAGGRGRSWEEPIWLMRLATVGRVLAYAPIVIEAARLDLEADEYEAAALTVRVAALREGRRRCVEAAAAEEMAEGLRRRASQLRRMRAYAAQVEVAALRYTEAMMDCEFARWVLRLYE